MMTRVASAIGKVNQWCAAGCGFLALGKCALITYDVVLRYVFSAPLGWAEEISAYIIVVTGFMGLGYATLVRSHVRVDLIIMRLPRWLRVRTEIVNAVAGMLYGIVLTIGAWRLAWMGLVRWSVSNSLLAVPLFPVYIWLAIGSLFLLLQLVVNLWETVKASQKAPEVVPEGEVEVIMREDQGL